MKHYWPMLALPFLMTGCLSSNSTTQVAPQAAGKTTPVVPAEEVQTKEVSGFSLPSSIETVPSQSSTGNSRVSAMRSIASVEEVKSDMEKDQFHLNVFEKSLDEFQIIDQLLYALKQTKYEDSQFINKGPYGTLIRWQEDNKLEKWIIDSKMLTIDGKAVNQVNMWVQEDGGLIEAQFNIYAPATALNRYGDWNVQARMLNTDGSTRGRFAAKTSLNEAGQAIVRIQHHNMGDGDGDFNGKLVLKDDIGSGIFLRTYQNQTENLRYSYNLDHLIVDKAGEKSCKDRKQYEDFTLDYNVYTADGMNIKNQKRFGFPLRLASEDTVDHERYIYYGAYHNRHSLWMGKDRELPAEGSMLIRSDNNKNETYRYYGRHKGFFAKKMIKNAELSDLSFQILATNTYENFNIRYNENDHRYYKCEMQMSFNCDIPFDMADLQDSPELRKDVRIYSWQGEVSMDNHQAYDGETLWISINQPLYLEYDGNQWSKWSYSFAENSTDWLPTFLEKAPYTFDKSMNFFVQAQDFGYNLDVAVENGLTLFSVKQYSEHIILPGAEATQAANLIYKDRWSQQEFVFDQESMNLLSTDGTLITDGKWDLEGSDGEIYQWAYPRNEDDNYANIDYLTDANGDFVFLDEAVYFATFQLGEKMMSGLGFDGHMRGLPDYYRLFRDSNGEMTDEIKSKIVNIPAGKYFDREDKEKYYFIKPVRGIRVLNQVSLESCSVTVDSLISLDQDSLFQDFVSSEFKDQELKVVEGVIL